MCVPPDCTETPVDEMCIPPRCTDLTGSFNHITNPSFEDGTNGWEVKLEGTFDEKWCPHGDGTEVKQLKKGEKLAIGTGEIPPFDGNSFMGSWVCSTGASSIQYRQRLGMAPGLLNDLTFALYDTFPESDPNESWKWSLGVQVELLDASENSIYTLTYGITRDDYEFPPITSTSMTRTVEPVIDVEGNNWKAFALKPAREIMKAGIDPTKVALVDLRFVVKGFNSNYYLLLDDVKMGHGVGEGANYFDNPEGMIAPSSTDQSAPLGETAKENVRKWEWKDDPDGDEDKDCIPNAKDACPETPGVTAEEGCPIDDDVWELKTLGPGVTSARFEWRYTREYKVYAKSFAVKVTQGPSPKIDGVETVDTVSDEYAWHTVTVGPYNPSRTECLDLSVTFVSQDPLWAADTFTLTPCTKVVGKAQGTMAYVLNTDASGKLGIFGRTGYDPVTINVKVSDVAGAVLADKDVKNDLVFEGENLEGPLNVALTNTYRSDCDKMLHIESDYPVLLSATADGALAYARREVIEDEYGLDALVLATTINYPDAIVGGAIAKKLGVPELLTPPEELPEDVASFIADERPKEIILIGGTAVISADIEEKLLADGFDVVRLWGMTRFGTAAELAQYAWNAGVDEAVVVYDRSEGTEGDEHTQLVMAKSLAAARIVPILLTSNEELSEATKEALEDLGVKKVTLVGPAFAAEVVEALDALNIEVEVVTGETVEEVNEKLQEEVVEELEKNLPEGGLTRLVVVAAGTDFMASISLPALPEATASLVLADEEQIQDVIDFITEHGIKEVTVVGIPELTSKVVARLLLVEGIEVSALSTKSIEKSLVDRLKERKDTWKEHRKERLVDRRRELIRRGDEIRERTERAVEKAQRIITEVSAALEEFKTQELPDELKPVLEMFEKELGRSRDLVERAKVLTENADGDGRAYADAIQLLKKAEGVARDAKFRGMKMITESERRQREKVRHDRDALADDIFGELEERESLRNRILGKRDKLDELRERVKERKDEKKFGPDLNKPREFGPKFGGDRFAKRDLGNRRIGKDFSVRGDSCKKCLTKCDREEEGPECAFICADSCGQSPCELCHEHCPTEAPMPEMCPMICDEVCSMAADVADARGFKPPMPPGRDNERVSSGVTCCQPDHGANTPACTVDLRGTCPEGYRALDDEAVDPFDDFNCVGERGKRGPRCDEFGLKGDGRRPDYGREPQEDDDWLPPTDAFRRGPGPRCKGCMQSCTEKGEDGAECGFVCEPVCQLGPCDLCEGWCDATGIPMRDCDVKCMPACDERSDRDGFGEGRQCGRCVDDCLEETGSIEQCSGLCSDPCHRDPCGVCNSYCQKGSSDPRECRDECRQVCDGGQDRREPTRSDPVTECRDKCKRSGDVGACMQQCLSGQDRPEPTADRPPPVPEGPGPIEVCRKQCSSVSDTRACMDQCIAREEGRQDTYGGPSTDDYIPGGSPGFFPGSDPCDECHQECDRSDWQDQGSCHARCDEDKCGGGPKDECHFCWEDCEREGGHGCEERCKPICERFHPPMPPPGDMCGECWYKCEEEEQRPQYECERECKPLCEFGGMPPPPPPHDRCGNCFYECEFKENQPWSECEQRCKPGCGFGSGPGDMPPSGFGTFEGYVPPGDLVGESNPQPAPGPMYPDDTYVPPGDLVGESNPQPAP